MEDRNRYLLISDVDGTLLGDGESLAEFAAWCAPRRDHLRLVYNSGRLYSSVAESVEETALPIPDAVIGGVGTQIRAFPRNRPIGEWPADRIGWQPLRICAALEEFDELQLQPPEFLADFKISYFVHNATPEFLQDIRSRLQATGCDVELVYSSDRDLDVLPRGVNKGTAAAYLAQQWSIPSEHVFVSGDTANDLAMFEVGFKGIVVGNAHPELKQLNSASVFHATRTHAGGVLEGLRHWIGN